MGGFRGRVPQAQAYHGVMALSLWFDGLADGRMLSFCEHESCILHDHL